MQRRITLGAIFLLFILAVGAIAVILLQRNSSGSTLRARPADQTEIIAETEFSHYFSEASGFTWHHVEVGTGEPVLLLHGIPGAWYNWHDVMTELKDSYHLIAVDLKGLGLTDAPEGSSYNAETVAAELVALMDSLGINRFALVTHEWGSVIGSYLAGNFPDHVTHFIRLQAPLSDAAIAQIATLRTLPQIGEQVLADSEGFVRRMYTGESSSFLMNNVPGPVVIQPIAEDDVARIAVEFSYEGIPQTIIQYYSDTSSDLRAEINRLAVTSTMPVLLLQADSDPIQPFDFYIDSASAFPNARLEAIVDSGHVPMLEQPVVLSERIDRFIKTSN
ncbi:MAG: alpha/beta hydrolase [Chloroflexota bacterium]|nr:alpha/beta hydrolase [Chloroflexota bacterium]